MFYLDLFRALEREQVRYVLIGGVAVNLHGIGRFTVDVDLMLALDGGNLSRFVAAVRPFQITPVFPARLDDFMDMRKVKGWIETSGKHTLVLRPAGPMAPTVDVLIKPAVPFEEVYARQVTQRIGGITVRIAAIEDIIRLKMDTGRQKDAADIKALTQLMRLKQPIYG